jgi:hypothetical protein
LFGIASERIFAWEWLEASRLAREGIVGSSPRLHRYRYERFVADGDDLWAVLFDS